MKESFSWVKRSYGGMKISLCGLRLWILEGGGRVAWDGESGREGRGEGARGCKVYPLS